jgi:K(+)-stimulated pyrophosphate-energized sodium pump
MNSSIIVPLWWIAPLSALLSLITGVFLYRKVMKADPGNETMQEIAGHVREGALAYLFRQYKVVFGVFLLIMIIFGAMALSDMLVPFVPIAFLPAGFFSALCGFIGMKAATDASSRTAQACSEGLNRGLQVAFRSGAIMGLSVVGFGLLDISFWYFVLDRIIFTPEHMAEGWEHLGMTLVPEGCTPIDKLVYITTTMVTFGMGASTQALFARVGGGIYTKAADVGADLVGKVEAGIPEDDPRNPATIADNVGDNVGDVAGMGADLYESYYGSILATAALGAAAGAQQAAAAMGTPDEAGAFAKAVGLVTAPMIVAGIGILLSIVGIFFVRCREGATQRNLLRSLLVGTLGSSSLIVLALIGLWMGGILSGGIVLSVISGLAAGVIIGQSTEFYTSDEYKPTQGIAHQAEMGPATTIIDGLAVGMYSAGIPVVTIVIGILCAFGFAGGFDNLSMGLYGIGFAAVGMLSTLGITLATDAYGPIADNAGGNAEMSHLPAIVRERTDALDSLGNTTAATGKGFAIGSAALTAMALLAAYIEQIKLWIGKMAGDGTFMGFTQDEAAKAGIMDFVDAFKLHIMNPMLLCGLFLGCMMAYVFCAMTMKAVGRAAGSMVEEVRRQFSEIPGIIEGTGKPDYARCVEISTKGAQKEMILPALLAIFVPVATGIILGIPGVLGLLTGGLAGGFVLATLLNNAGGAWDNAKKYIESGEHGGKGSEAHKAGVVGDTVGDPCKDTCGPSLNILIKLMTIVSVVFAPIVVKFSPIVQGWLGIGLR